jgi:hypothetical protein
MIGAFDMSSVHDTHAITPLPTPLEDAEIIALQLLTGDDTHLHTTLITIPTAPADPRRIAAVFLAAQGIIEPIAFDWQHVQYSAAGKARVEATWHDDSAA